MPCHSIYELDNVLMPYTKREIIRDLLRFSAGASLIAVRSHTVKGIFNEIYLAFEQLQRLYSRHMKQLISEYGYQEYILNQEWYVKTVVDIYLNLTCNCIRAPLFIKIPPIHKEDLKTPTPYH
jgi:hypothetical protein